MAKLTILGSANAIPDEQHENTHMALQGKHNFLLIDCVSNPIVRLKQAGLNFNDISDMILTHFHPDHVSGVPLLLMDMWLLGRQKPLRVYGLHHTLDRIENLMGFYDWSLWPDFFSVAFIRLPHQDMTLVLENEEFRVFSSPVRHLVPTIGLRIEFLYSGKSLAYSCDTEPCPQVIELASDADVLIHEAAGATKGHSSAAQAALVAREAEVKSLYLIHYPTREVDPQDNVAQARQVFPGEVVLAQDFMVLDF